MIRPSAWIRLAIAAIAPLAVLGGCNGADTAEVAPSAEAVAPSTTPSPAATPVNPAVTPTPTTPANTATAPTPTAAPTSNTQGEYQPPRLLTPAELGWVERNLASPEQSIIVDQSFWIQTRAMGEVAFVATQVVNDLELLLMLPNGEIGQVLPPNEDAASWVLWEMKAVTFLELDFDGSEPDMIVLADYITGVGPTGSEPFTVATVYLNQGSYFTTDTEVNRFLTDRGVQTLAEAEDVLRSELDFLP